MLLSLSDVLGRAEVEVLVHRRANRKAILAQHRVVRYYWAIKASYFNR
jgi:hypothetical protein